MNSSTIKQVYGESGAEVYDSFMQTYFGLFDESTKKAYVDFFEKLQLKPRQRVLDVGFGTGLILHPLPDFIDLTGIDIIPQMLETARKRAVGLGRNLECRLYGGQEIPYPDNSFDRVVETFTLCVAENPLQVFKEMVRVCKPEGIIGLFDYKKATSNPHVSKDQQLLSETMRRGGIYHGGWPAVVFDPLFDLDSLVKQDGLEIRDQLRIEKSFIESLGRYVLIKR